MEEYVPETELEENLEISHNISILDEEYELSIKINGTLLEFKLKQENIIDEYNYKAKFQLEAINKLLLSSFGRIREVFDFFDNLLKEKKVNLIQSKDKTIIKLNFKNITQNIEANIELNKYKLSKDEMNLMFIKEINALKKKLNSKNEKSFDELIKETKQEYQKILNDKIIEKDKEIKDLKKEINQLKQEQEKKLNEIKKIFERKNFTNENILNPIIVKEKEKKEIIKYDKVNDNVNLINDFTNINFENMKNKTIANNLNIKWLKSVAVYKIIRNNEISYEIAYPENENGYNIIIYNLIKKTTNTISNAHKNSIQRIKHYYDSLRKNDILLTSSEDKSIKLWNISSNTSNTLNILHIPNCFDGFNDSPFCLMFYKEDYYMLGGSVFKKINKWDKNGNLIDSIEKSQLKSCSFIETAYFNNEPYILLSGDSHSECYDYNNKYVKIYKSNNKKYIHYISNLFRSNNKIYLISGDSGGNIIIFDFISTNEIGSISVDDTIYSLCSINEKYILAGNKNGELKVIDFDNKSIIKKYKAHSKSVLGIEKIKINEKKEYFITYDLNKIKLWG